MGILASSLFLFRGEANTSEDGKKGKKSMKKPNLYLLHSYEFALPTEKEKKRKKATSSKLLPPTPSQKNAIFLTLKATKEGGKGEEKKQQRSSINSLREKGEGKGKRRKGGVWVTPFLTLSSFKSPHLSGEERRGRRKSLILSRLAEKGRSSPDHRSITGMLCFSAAAASKGEKRERERKAEGFLSFLWRLSFTEKGKGKGGEGKENGMRGLFGNTFISSPSTTEKGPTRPARFSKKKRRRGTALSPKKKPG